MGARSVNQASQTSGKADVYIFAILTRLRQYCGHPALVPDEYIENAYKKQSGESDNSEDLEDAIESISDGAALCGVCGRTPKVPRITDCHHIFWFVRDLFSCLFDSRTK